MDFSIFCKSWAPDLLRAKRLAGSIQVYNADRIPFYLSCPEADLALFKAELAEFSQVEVFSDEEILDKTRASEPKAANALAQLPSHLIQQVVKAEYWRLGISENYLVVDSDSLFIRPFALGDFLVSDALPYTVCHECKDLLSFAARQNKVSVRRDYEAERKKFQTIFERTGRCYDFGPTPVIWSSKVWQGLYETYAVPRKTNMAEMIQTFPSELLWYGEYLLHSRIIPMMPAEPLFKVFHYKAQYEESRQLGENEDTLSETYMGIVMQSNWDRELSYKASGARGVMGRLKRLFS